MHTAWVLLILIEEGFVLAQKTKGLHNVGQTNKSAGQCGTWIQNSNGGLLTSPNYPDTYPPNKECVFILEALPRQRIELTFDETYYIEPSFECRFDYIEVRDGPFGFSPLINRFCGPSSPGMVRSTGRFMWIKFSSDEELEGLGFRVKYAFIADPDFRLHVGDIFSPIPDCQFELMGFDGVIHSSQVEEEAKIKSGSAVDCIWTVRAPPRSKIYLRFMEYQMEHSNECKKNFVAVYDGSSAIENLKAKFCSTIANDIMLDNGVAVVRMWADENSRLSRFRLLFTSFVEPPCSDDTFFCHSNMCINNSLVCNGVQNCVYPWDENQCREKSSSLLNQIIRARGTVIGVSAGIVLVLLFISIVVQMKQPRKKILSRKPPLHKAGFQEVFNPPHYNLFSLRDKEMSSDLADLSDDLESYHKLRRNSVASRCIHEHHCGSLASSLKPSQADLSSMELLYHNDFSQSQTLRTLNSTYKKSCCVYKQAHDCAENVIEDRVLEEIPCEIYMHGNKRATSSKHCISMDF